MLELNDIHGHVIKTKPTESFEGSGEYKRESSLFNEPANLQHVHKALLL